MHTAADQHVDAVSVELSQEQTAALDEAGYVQYVIASPDRSLFVLGNSHVGVSKVSAASWG